MPIDVGPSAPGGRRARSASLTSPIVSSPKWKTLAASTASAPGADRRREVRHRPGAAAGDHRDRRPPRRTAAISSRSKPALVPSASIELSRISPAPSSAPRRGPLDRVDARAAPAAVRGHLEAAAASPGARRTSSDSTSTWRPNRSAISAISSGRAIAAVFTPTLSAPARSSTSTSDDRAHAAADGQRDEDRLGGAAHHVEHRAPVVRRGGHVEEGQLVGAGRVVRRGQLDRVAGVAQVDEVDALDHPPGVHVQAGDHPDRDAHGRRPQASMRAPRGR